MPRAAIAEDRDSLYALSWSYAQDGKLAVDVATGILADANPVAEALLGYSRAELTEMHITNLHPEAERERVEAEFRKGLGTRPRIRAFTSSVRKAGVCRWRSGRRNR
jgi:PAS domain S-box-containing protein